MYFILYEKKNCVEKFFSGKQNRAQYTKKSEHFNGCLTCELLIDSSQNYIQIGNKTIFKKV